MENDPYKTKAKIAYEYILKKIHNQRVKPGEKLIIEDVSKEMGISRIPVREAFRKLESEGILENFPNKSSRVKRICMSDIEDLYEIRKIIEPRAAVMALKSFTRQDIEYLETNLKKMEKSLKESNIQAYIDLNKDFHFYIYKKSNNKWLPQTIETLWFFARWVNVATYFEDKVKKEYIYSHSKILDAIRMKDKKNLEKAFTQHLEQSKKDVIRYFLEKKFFNE